ncbi:2509_t:CDS:2 [Funneliformis geosporum]|uniref:13452_t:CDS:1 n=1 Tax=Funneliformis geosporum TaxID=1117311 RepID=A0A9W4SFJ3_9GLOM|nr:2509_t:CDS:2 [Funneliformis geosporum]CAI2166712.1 13452_t:CDS:2 [Funneliformis geosporum]
MLSRKDILLNSYPKISYSRNTKPFVFLIAKVICFLFVILSELIPVQSICDPYKPGEATIDQMFCNPKEGEEYRINDDVLLSWNYANANLFDSNGQNKVQIYLFRIRQDTAYEVLVSLDPGNFNYLAANRISNSINITVQPRWIPVDEYSNPPKSHLFFFRVIPNGSGKEYDLSFSTPQFKVIQPDLLNSTTTSLETQTVQTVPTAVVPVITSPHDSEAQEDKSENKVLIAVIVVASLAALLAFIAVLIAIRSKRRSSHHNKHKSHSNLSTSSSTPMVAPLSIGKFRSNNRDSESPIEAESIHSTTPLAMKEDTRLKPKSTVSNENQPISASDAALLSDAFRKVLRKPDWKPEEDDDDGMDLSSEERLRRREAKELMKKELAEEGTDLQNLSRRHTKVEIRNISDEQARDGASISSESGSK